MVEEIRTFMKRRAEIEYTYHEEIAKLCMQHQSARKTKPQSKEERPVNKAWVVFLEESRAYARSRGVFAEKLREELTNPMKPFLDDRRRSFAKSSEFGQKLQEGLQTTMADLIRVRFIDILHRLSHTPSRPGKGDLRAVLQRVRKGLGQVRGGDADANGDAQEARLPLDDQGQVGRRTQEAKGRFAKGSKCSQRISTPGAIVPNAPADLRRDLPPRVDEGFTNEIVEEKTYIFLI